MGLKHLLFDSLLSSLIVALVGYRHGGVASIPLPTPRVLTTYIAALLKYLLYLLPKVIWTDLVTAQTGSSILSKAGWTERGFWRHCTLEVWRSKKKDPVRLHLYPRRPLEY